LIKGKKLVKVSADLIFHPDALEHIKRSISAHKGRRFTVPEFKEWTNVSRKYAIPLLEFLDREHVTRREGDTRVVL
jgi:selenocysteine-specific elongation factor